MKLIVPIDFSENSIKALEFAIALAEKRNSKITLVHAVEIFYDFASQAATVITSLLKEADSKLKKLIKKYKPAMIVMNYQVVEGNPAISIARVAAENGAAMIVMGTQGASGIKKNLFGTITVKVVKETTCPILIVPAEAKGYEIHKVTLAMEFANHEAQFIDWIVSMSKRWNLGLEVLHIQTHKSFKDDLATLGIAEFLEQKYPGLPVKIHTHYADTAVEGLDQYLGEHENLILVMCHQHRNLWEQFSQKSQSIQMAYHTHIPLLIMS